MRRDDFPWLSPLGALPRADGTVEFRVWAPRAQTASVRIAGGEHELEPAGHGVHEGIVPGRAGDDYAFVLDGGAELPDPCSRSQPGGAHGRSRVIDLESLPFADAGWEGVPLEELVLYELHVGTFTEKGTFDAVVPRLPELVELGVTAIELMPVATFPGERGWGYDGVYLSAPHRAYGGPEGLARLVDAAHRLGLGVVLDVVYNHVGPGSDALSAFGPYFTARYRTPWGDAVNFDGPDSEPVREWAIQNACLWVRDYHVDGLRLDAVHAIYDVGARHVLAELAERVGGVASRQVLVIAESDLNDPRVIRPPDRGGWGLDAQWADDFHHALHVLLTGERDGYYADFGSVGDLAKAYRRPFVYDGRFSRVRRRRHGAPVDDRPPDQFVVYAQNHDQVGNRAAGDRLPRQAGLLAAFCTLLSPFRPLLFMGEEYGEERPFQFFTDHPDPLIAEATREGRRREFAGFAGFAGEVPDPQARETCERSRLAAGRGDPGTRDLYRRLLRLRREIDGEVTLAEADEERRLLRVVRGAHELVCNFSREERTLVTAKRALLLATDAARLEEGVVSLPGLSGAVLR